MIDYADTQPTFRVTIQHEGDVVSISSHIVHISHIDDALDIVRRALFAAGFDAADGRLAFIDAHDEKRLDCDCQLSDVDAVNK
jgi:hypothetical protein